VSNFSKVHVLYPTGHCSCGVKIDLKKWRPFYSKKEWKDMGFTDELGV